MEGIDINTMHPVSVIGIAVGIMWALVYAMVKFMNGPNVTIQVTSDQLAEATGQKTAGRRRRRKRGSRRRLGSAGQGDDLSADPGQ